MSRSVYRTQATAIGGQASAVASIDGSLKAQLSDRRAGGVSGPGTTAEQLLASALAASFLEGLKIAAAAADLTLASDANVTAAVCVDFGIEVPILHADLDVDLPGLDHETVLALVAKARRGCPYAHLFPGHFDVQVSVL